MLTIWHILHHSPRPRQLLGTAGCITFMTTYLGWEYRDYVLLSLRGKLKPRESKQATKNHTAAEGRVRTVTQAIFLRHY